MKIIDKQNKLSLEDLKKMAEDSFGDFVKAVVDIDKTIMAVDADLHADEEELLLKSGSKQDNLWGINIYPKIKKDDWIEFDSMINLRPSLDNLSRGVKDPKVKEKIKEIVDSLINET